MSIITKFFSKSSVITSDMIRNEISEAESKIADHRAKIQAANVSVALLSDEAHVKIENEIAADRRAIMRLQTLVSHLNDELPKVEAAEEAAQAAAKDEALRKRAEDCRKANAVEGKKLLTEFDKLASQMGDVLARIKEIADETMSVNKALHANRVADSIICYENLYRQRPAGYYEFPFSEIILPTAFAGGKAHWPR
jgi:HPt (histidine-containing phosphotransfer) domain-containing protein